MSHYYRNRKNGYDAYSQSMYTMQALSLEIDLRRLAGQVETDAIMKSLPAGLTAANLCMALQAEIDYWAAVLDGEIDCEPLGGW